MLSEILNDSRHRADCKNNYLSVCMEELVQLMRKFERMAPEEYQQLLGQRCFKKKGEVLLREGESNRYFWFLETGVARAFYLLDGEEITHNLFFPCQFVDAYAASSCNLPPNFSIHLLADSHLRLIDRALLAKLEQKYPLLLQMKFKIVGSHALWLLARDYSLQHYNATDRYKQLLHTQAHYVQRVPLKFIASYLCISDQTLSRIRSHITNN